MQTAVILMELARIRIQEPEQAARGVYELMKRFQIITLRDTHANGDESRVVYFVPEPALVLLDELAVRYELIERCSHEDAVQALRGSAAVTVQ